MLFDIQDYVNVGLLGCDWDNIMDLIDNGVQNQWGNLVHGGDFEMVAEIARATRDAFFKAVNEYTLAAAVANYENRVEIETLLMAFNDARIDLGWSWKSFWDAYLSIPYLGGRNGGEEGFNATPSASAGFSVFTVMTQEIYDDYHAKLSTLTSIAKDIIERAEGNPIIE